jgi:hypothetical protein
LVDRSTDWIIDLDWLIDDGFPPRYPPAPCTNMPTTLAPRFPHPTTTGMNIIDLLAVAPYYLSLWKDVGEADLVFLRLLRLVRVMRIFKLGRCVDHMCQSTSHMLPPPHNERYDE